MKKNRRGKNGVRKDKTHRRKNMNQGGEQKCARNTPKTAPSGWKKNEGGPKGNPVGGVRGEKRSGT